MNNESFVGQQIDQYHVLQHIASGGMADVYLAEDVNLKRKVALKIMFGSLAANPQFVERFRREAQMVAHLDHPNIVQVYAVGLTPAQSVGGLPQGTPYIAMQYIEGGSLREKLEQLAERGKLLTTEQALNIIRQVALALGVAHNAQIIHRDLKPGNVLVQPDGTPVLVDLGIALAADNSKLTQTGAIIGTPHYMSPEQVREQPLDGRSDLYSLGIILYELLAGRRPFAASESIAVLHQHVYEKPPPLGKRRPDLLPQVLAIVEKCLQKEPAHRYQNANELIQAIDLALQSQGIQGPNPQATQVLTDLHDSGLLSRRQVVRLTTAERRRKLPVPLWAILTFLALIAAGLLLLLVRQFDQTPATPENPIAAQIASQKTAVPQQATSVPTQIVESEETAVLPTNTLDATPVSSPVPDTPTPVLPTETAVPPTPIPSQPQIVFQSNRDGDYEIYIMNSDGSQQRPLTNNSADDNYPVVSLDGTQVLFESIRDGNWEVYVMNIDGSQQRRLTDATGSRDRLPTWSPDGQQIAFVSDRDGDYEIFTMNADGSNLRQITFNTLREGHMSWSVDNRLVYNAGTEDSRSWDIYTIDPDGNNQQKLTDNTISDWAPEWSPDGRFILYLSLVNSDPAIFIMNADGSNGRLLYNSAFYDWGADWTADGSNIIFTTDEADTGVIYIMNADGSGVRKLTERGSYPSWVK